MGWTNDQFTGTLTVPTGSTSGQRIVIDGTNGTITGYDSSNNVVFTITPTDGFASFGTDQSVQAPIGGQLSAGTLELSANGPTNALPFSASVSWAGGVGNEVLQTLLQSARSGIPGIEAPFIAMESGSAAGTTDDEISLNSSLVSTSGDFTVSGDTFILNLVDQGRGLVAREPITASTVAVTTTQTVGIDTGDITFQNGRAYKVVAKGWVQSTVGGDTVRIRILKGAIGGAGYIDSFDGLSVNSNNGMTAFYLENNIRNISGADVTDDLVMTYVRSGGTGNVLLGASAPNPAYIEVWDIGAAAAFPSANAIT